MRSRGGQSRILGHGLAFVNMTTVGNFVNGIVVGLCSIMGAFVELPGFTGADVVCNMSHCHSWEERRTIGE